MWTWVLFGICVVSGVVSCLVAEVTVGGRDLGHMVLSRVAGVAVGRRDLNWERIPVRASLGYDANDLSLKLEGFSSGACGHGSCLVPVF